MIKRPHTPSTSIRFKIILMVSLVVFTIMTIGLVAIGTWSIRNQYKVTKMHLSLDVKLIGDYCVIPLYFEDKAMAQEALGRLGFLKSVESGFLLDRKGNVFATFHNEPLPDLFPKADSASHARMSDGALYVQEPIFYQGGYLGSLLVKAETKDLKTEGFTLLIRLLLLLLSMLLLSVLLASWIQKSISLPILKLAEETKRISETQDFDIQLEVPGADEVGALYQNYNHLLIQLRTRQAERDAAEQGIRDLNASLEQKVEERTALLEKANKELEAFSYSVSHDLRAPLRHVNGYLDLLLKRNYEQLDEKGKHYMEAISESATQMGRLIDDLLQFSRAGRTELKPDRVGMNQLLEDALTILKPETEGRNIEWKLARLPVVYADYSMLRQVWVNLLSNAVKYTRKCEVAQIEVGFTEEDSRYVFFVRDNGAGFDMHYADKLFGVFQRLHNNEEFEGTGIGLANVRQIVVRHKGETWAEAEVDKGATFYFSLPK